MPSLYSDNPLALGTETTWFIGMVIAAISYGVLITLGVACFFLAPTHTSQPAARLQKFFRIYIIILLMLNTVAEINDVRLTSIAIFQFGPRIGRTLNVYADHSNVTTLLITLMTDGFLVWRCYKLNQALSPINVSVFQRFAWVIPALLWAAIAVSGIIGCYTINYFAFGVTLVSNVTLNLFVALYITIRLVNPRPCWTTLVPSGNIEPRPYFRTVILLVESATISVPFSVMAAVGIALKNPLGTLAFQVTVPCQTIASFLIIYQVEAGRSVVGISQRDQKPLEIV